MKKQLQWTILILGLSGLVACGAPSDVTDSATQPQESTQHRTQIYTDQFNALEKSKNLAHNLNQAELSRRKQIEEATP